MSNELSTLLAELQAAQDALQKWKDHEMKLRLKVAAEFGHKHGSESMDLPEGWKVKCTKKTRYNVTTDLAKMAEAYAEFGGEKFNLVFSQKYSFKTSGYGHLSDAEKRAVNMLVTSKPATPTVEFIPPKDGGN